VCLRQREKERERREREREREGDNIREIVRVLHLRERKRLTERVSKGMRDSK
jgi:hypothetical protein